MSTYFSPDEPARRRSTLPAVGAGLGAFSFLVGFLPFYTAGNNGISGYALGTPTSAAIGFSVFAGLLCAAAVFHHGRAASIDGPAAPAAALTALLLAIANLLSKGSLSGDVSFGFVLFLLGLVVQAGLLAWLWLSDIGRIRPSFGPPAGAQPYPSVGAQPGGPYRSPPVQHPGGPVPPYPTGAPGQFPDYGSGPFYPPPRP